VPPIHPRSGHENTSERLKDPKNLETSFTQAGMVVNNSLLTAPPPAWAFSDLDVTAALKVPVPWKNR
jgi:hypothetical protein